MANKDVIDRNRSRVVKGYFSFSKALTAEGAEDAEVMLSLCVPGVLRG